MKKISISNIIIYLLSCISIFISFYFNEDGSNTPLSGDFRDTWPYVLNLKENILSDPTGYTVHYPLHYFLLSRINFIISDPTGVRFFMMLVSLFMPFLLFKVLQQKYQNKNINILFIISLCIFFTPAFRYASIWANDRITTDIFILVGSYFFFLFYKNRNIIKNIYISLLFFALACYSRQYYAVYYSLFLIYILKNDTLKNFFYLSLYSILLSLPGFYILYKSPFVFGGLQFSGNIFNTFLGNTSSLFVYTLPILLINIIFKNKFFNLKKILFITLFSIIIFLIVYKFHEISLMDENGGAFLVFSKLIFKNYIAFYIVFFFNLILLLLLFENYQDRLILLSIVIIFSGRIVVQSLFEPLFFLFFFLYSNSKYKNIFLENKRAAYSLFGYYIFYYFVSVSDILYKISF